MMMMSDDYANNSWSPTSLVFPSICKSESFFLVDSPLRFLITFLFLGQERQSHIIEETTVMNQLQTPCHPRANLIFCHFAPQNVNKFLKQNLNVLLFTHTSLDAPHIVGIC